MIVADASRSQKFGELLPHRPPTSSFGSTALLEFAVVQEPNKVLEEYLSDFDGGFG
jgi:hypothetical protein